MKAHAVILIFSICFTLFTRLYGNNWDSSFHLHPDERFLTMVSQSISLPSNIFHIFSTAVSTLNPHNVGHEFYVYGTFPLYFVKILATLFSLTDYSEINLLGRVVSGLADVGIAIMIYLISRRYFKDPLVASFSVLFYSALVLPIQLSHFYTVDTFMSLFLTISLYFLLRYIQQDKKPYLTSSFLGLFFGLALASKYSAALFAPLIALGYLLALKHKLNVRDFAYSVIIFIITFFLSFRLFQPFFFSGFVSPNPKIIENLQTLKSFEDTTGWFPPAVQWINTPKIIFPAINLFWWGIGPSLSIIGIFSFLTMLRQIRKIPEIIPILIWIFGLYIYVGMGFAMTARYFYPLLPALSVISGFGIYKLFKTSKAALFLLLLLGFIPSVAFMSVYFHPHTRVQASEWIKENIPAGSTLSCEEWDDCLPLGYNYSYPTIQLKMYQLDTDLKWIQLQRQLSQIDYLIISSNRIFASISSAPELYPKTKEFYHRLFSGDSDFRLVAKFISRPTLPFPGEKICLRPPSIEYGSISSSLITCNGSGLELIDDFAEEAYTVYDHPAVFIFSKKSTN